MGTNKNVPFSSDIIYPRPKKKKISLISFTSNGNFFDLRDFFPSSKNHHSSIWKLRRDEKRGHFHNAYWATFFHSRPFTWLNFFRTFQHINRLYIMYATTVFCPLFLWDKWSIKGAVSWHLIRCVQKKAKQSKAAGLQLGRWSVSSFHRYNLYKPLVGEWESEWP